MANPPLVATGDRVANAGSFSTGSTKRHVCQLNTGLRRGQNVEDLQTLTVLFLYGKEVCRLTNGIVQTKY
jgi:hypothetical protein